MKTKMFVCRNTLCIIYINKEKTSPVTEVLGLMTVGVDNLLSYVHFWQIRPKPVKYSSTVHDFQLVVVVDLEQVFSFLQFRLFRPKFFSIRRGIFLHYGSSKTPYDLSC